MAREKIVVVTLDVDGARGEPDFLDEGGEGRRLQHHGQAEQDRDGRAEVRTQQVGGEQQDDDQADRAGRRHRQEDRSEEHTSELQSPMRLSYAALSLKKKKEMQQEQV